MSPPGSDHRIAYAAIGLFVVSMSFSCGRGPAGPTGANGANGVGYVRTIVVSPADDSQESGNQLLAALDSITAATSDSRFLLKIEPGVYQVTRPLVMKEHVDIEGSGELTTTIIGVDTTLTRGTLVGANSAELRNLTVAQCCYLWPAVAVFISGTSPRLTQVTVSSGGGAIKLIDSSSKLERCTVYGSHRFSHGIDISGGAPNLSYIHLETPNTGISIESSRPSIVGTEVLIAGEVASGINLSNSTATIRDSLVRAAGGFGTSGLAAFNTTAELTNVTIEAGDPDTLSSATAVTNGGTSPGTVTMNHGIIRRISRNGLSVENTGTVRIGASQISGPIGGSGTFICASSYSEDFVPLGPNCL